ncbi:hypothetical protein AADZ86_17955 [Colwelliaceae bacterium BS250]
MKNGNYVVQVSSGFYIPSPKQLGFVLASNLIMMLLLTLIATALFKNSLTETQMATLYHLQLRSHNDAQQAVITITAHLESMVNNNSDFSKATLGFYPKNQPQLLNNINWLDNTRLLSTNSQVRYVINYLGRSTKLTAPKLDIEYHLFKVFIYSKAAKGSEYVEQVFISIEVD